MGARRRRIAKPVVLLVASALALASSRNANAANANAGPSDDDAEALISRGIDLREQGKDDEALALFRRALTKEPSPRARAQVALAEQALGLWVAAEADLVLALTAENDAWIARNRAALEGALAFTRRHLGSLEIRGADGAEVALDGIKLGALPAAKPFRVEAGRRLLEISAKGFYRTSRTIEVPPGGTARETVSLVALRPEDGTTDEGQLVERGHARNEADPAKLDPGKSQRLLGWVSTGTGAALIGLGAVSLLVRNGLVNDYNERCPGLGVAQPASCDDKLDATRTWMTVSVVSFVAGGLLAVGGITLVATAPPPSKTASGGPARIACAPALDAGRGIGMGCAGVF